jgi:thymidine phosphorylase
MPHHPGVVVGMDTRALGLTVVELGGGRRQAADAIDPGVGLSDIAPVGETVGPNRPLAAVHAHDAASAERAIQSLVAAVRVGESAPAEKPVVLKRIGTAA